MVQSPRLRQHYLSLTQVLLEQERLDLYSSIGSGADSFRFFLEGIDRDRMTSGTLEAANIPGFEETRWSGDAERLQRADHLLQPFLDATDHALEASMARAGLRVPCETYVCSLPSGIYNGLARETAGGVLILINSGLVSVVYGTSQLLGQARSFIDNKNLKHLSAAENVGQGLYTETQLAVGLRDILYAYLALGDARLSRKFPPQGGVRGQLSEALCASAIVFAVAHEFGHVIAGHVRAERNAVNRGPNQQGSDLTADNELEADRLASVMLRNLAGIHTNPQAPPIALAGPYIFLALAEALEQVQLLTGRPASQHDASHPSASTRQSILRNELNQYFRPESFELAEAAALWINKTTRSVISATQR